MKLYIFHTLLKKSIQIRHKHGIYDCAVLGMGKMGDPSPSYVPRNVHQFIPFVVAGNVCSRLCCFALQSHRKKKKASKWELSQILVPIQQVSNKRYDSIAIFTLFPFFCCCSCFKGFYATMFNIVVPILMSFYLSAVAVLTSARTTVGNKLRGFSSHCVQSCKLKLF